MPGTHEQLVDLLRDVHHSLGQHFKGILETHNLTPPAIMLCNQIRQEPGITLSEAARRTGIAKSHVSKILRDLEERGWLLREADAQDQRLARFYIDEQGQKELLQIRSQILARLNDLVASIPEQQAAAAIQALTCLKAVLQSRRD